MLKTKKDLLSPVKVPEIPGAQYKSLLLDYCAQRKYGEKISLGLLPFSFALILKFGSVIWLEDGSRYIILLTPRLVGLH